MAYIAGLQPGVPVILPITVVAEDGVTSLSYYVQILREVGGDNSSGDASNVLSGLLGDSPASSPSSSLDGSSVFLSSNPQLSSPPPPPFEKSQLQEGKPCDLPLFVKSSGMILIACVLLLRPLSRTSDS